MKKWWWAAVPVVAAGVWLAMSGGDAVNVEVVKAEKGTVERTVANTRAGTVKACQRSRLSLQIGGKVAQVYAREGDAVNKNQVLLELWNDDQKAAKAQAEAQLDLARHRYDQACAQAKLAARTAVRQDKLNREKFSSDEAVEKAQTDAQVAGLACQAAEADVDMAKAQLAMRTAALEQTYLRAPFAGVVAEINGEIGEYATPSPPGVATPPAVDLIDTSCLYVTAPIDEVDASELRDGLPARITLDAFRNRSFDGELMRIAPYVEELQAQARTVNIDVSFTPSQDMPVLLVGYSADVELILDSHANALRLPSEVVMADNKVYVINAEQRVEERQIKVGIANWDYTEVLEGLSADDLVIRSLDVAGLKPGVKAEVKP